LLWSPSLLAAISGPTSKGREREREGQERERRGKGGEGVGAPHDLFVQRP